MRNWLLGLVAATPFIWAFSGFVALSGPVVTDNPATVVVAQYFQNQ